MAKGHACEGSSLPITADRDCELWRREAGAPPISAFAPSAWEEEIVAAAAAWIWSARSLKPPPPSVEMPLPNGGKTMSMGAGVDISSDFSIPLALLVAPSPPSAPQLISPLSSPINDLTSSWDPVATPSTPCRPPSADGPCPPDICQVKGSVWCVRRGWAADKRLPTKMGSINVRVDGEEMGSF